MAITFDPLKRALTLAERGLDFADAIDFFAGPLVENPDERFDYGEERFVAFGFLKDRMIVIVWTPRGADRHVISMRKANKREQAEYGRQLGGSR